MRRKYTVSFIFQRLMTSVYYRLNSQIPTNSRLLRGEQLWQRPLRCVIVFV